MEMDKAFVVLKKRPVNAKRLLLRHEQKKDDILQRVSNKEPENSMQKVSTSLSFIASTIQKVHCMHQYISYFCIEEIFFLKNVLFISTCISTFFAVINIR